MILLLRILTDPPVEAVLAALAIGVLVLWRLTDGRRALALTLASVVSFAACEGLLRALNIGELEGGLDWIETTSDGRRWDSPYIPNGKLVYRYPDDPRGYFGPGNQVVGGINTSGFRGRNAERQKPEGTRRIAVLGDSFAVGYGVRDEDTLPSQLEATLDEDARPVEVLNFGRSATDTEYHVALLEHFVMDFEPDVVVIVFFLNDAKRIGTMSFTAGHDFLRDLRRHSRFVNALVARVTGLVQHRLLVWHYREGYREESEGWLRVRRELRHARTLASQNDFELVLAVYPVLIHLDERYPFRGVHGKIIDYANSVSLPAIDLLGAFEGQRDSEMWVHPLDHHANEVAQGIAARALAEFLESSGALGSEDRDQARGD